MANRRDFIKAVPYFSIIERFVMINRREMIKNLAALPIIGGIGNIFSQDDKDIISQQNDFKFSDLFTTVDFTNIKKDYNYPNNLHVYDEFGWHDIECYKKQNIKYNCTFFNHEGCFRKGVDFISQYVICRNDTEAFLQRKGGEANTIPMYLEPDINNIERDCYEIVLDNILCYTISWIKLPTDKVHYPYPFAEINEIQFPRTRIKLNNKHIKTILNMIDKDFSVTNELYLNYNTENMKKNNFLFKNDSYIGISTTSRCDAFLEPEYKRYYGKNYI